MAQMMIEEAFCSGTLYNLLIENGYCGDMVTKKTGRGKYTKYITLACARRFLRKVHGIDISIGKETSHLRNRWYYCAHITNHNCYVENHIIADEYEECEEKCVLFCIGNILVRNSGNKVKQLDLFIPDFDEEVDRILKQ